MASSEARKATAEEISAGSARRRSGVTSTDASPSSSLIGVLTGPGQMALTRMRCGACSSAATLVMAITAPLLAL
jgi:hypothetical protein